MRIHKFSNESQSGIHSQFTVKSQFCGPDTHLFWRTMQRLWLWGMTTNFTEMTNISHLRVSQRISQVLRKGNSPWNNSRHTRLICLGDFKCNSLQRAKWMDVRETSMTDYWLRGTLQKAQVPRCYQFWLHAKWGNSQWIPEECLATLAMSSAFT